MSEPEKPSNAECRRHPDEAAYFKFLERDDQSADYVRRNAEWLQKNYPGSATALLPKMRELYRRKMKAAKQ